MHVPASLWACPGTRMAVVACPFPHLQAPGCRDTARLGEECAEETPEREDKTPLDSSFAVEVESFVHSVPRHAHVFNKNTLPSPGHSFRAGQALLEEEPCLPSALG